MEASLFIALALIAIGDMAIGHPWLPAQRRWLRRWSMPSGVEYHCLAEGLVLGLQCA